MNKLLDMFLVLLLIVAVVLVTIHLAGRSVQVDSALLAKQDEITKVR